MWLGAAGAVVVKASSVHLPPTFPQVVTGVSAHRVHMAGAGGVRRGRMHAIWGACMSLLLDLTIHAHTRFQASNILLVLVICSALEVHWGGQLLG